MEYGRTVERQICIAKPKTNQIHYVRYIYIPNISLFQIWVSILYVNHCNINICSQAHKLSHSHLETVNDPFRYTLNKRRFKKMAHQSRQSVLIQLPPNTQIYRVRVYCIYRLGARNTFTRQVNHNNRPMAIEIMKYVDCVWWGNV